MNIQNKNIKKGVILTTFLFFFMASTFIFPQEKAKAVAPIIPIVAGAVASEAVSYAVQGALAYATDKAYQNADDDEIATKSVSSRMKADELWGMNKAVEEIVPNPKKPGWGKIALTGTLLGLVASLGGSVAEEIGQNGDIDYNEKMNYSDVPTFDSLTTNQRVDFIAPTNTVKHFLGFDVVFSMDQYWSKNNLMESGPLLGDANWSYTISEYRYDMAMYGIDNPIGITKITLGKGTHSGYLYTIMVSFTYPNTYGQQNGMILHHFNSDAGIQRIKEWYENIRNMGTVITQTGMGVEVPLEVPTYTPPTIEPDKIYEVEVPMPDHGLTKEELYEALRDHREQTVPNPSDYPSSEPVSEPGTEPGTEPGAEPGTEPGTEPTPEPGTSEPTTPEPLKPENQDKLNLDPLIGIGGELTRKFPFSLPWDIMRAVEQITVPGEKPSWTIKMPMPGGYVEKEITIPESMEKWVPAVRSAFVLMFMIGLIYSTRNLLGGSV